MKKNQKKIIIFWNNESLGYLLSNRIFFSLIKLNFPNSHLTVVISEKYKSFVTKPAVSSALGLIANFKIVTIQEFLFSKTSHYDILISPSLKNFSFIKHLIILFTKSHHKIGFKEFNDNINYYSFVFNKKIAFDWKSNPDVHFSEVCYKLIKSVSNEINNNFMDLRYFESSVKNKNNFKENFELRKDQKIIGINNSPKDFRNRWDYEILEEFLNLLTKNYDCFFYFIDESVEKFSNKSPFQNQKLIPTFKSNDAESTLNIIANSDLFLTCDSQVMHLAGFTSVNQISLFGRRNAFNWAPLGTNKKFLYNSDMINEIKPEVVFEISKSLLN